MSGATLCKAVSTQLIPQGLRSRPAVTGSLRLHTARMDKTIILRTTSDLEKIENSIFEAVVTEGHYVHILDIEHCCSSELIWLTKNKHPVIKIIKVTSNLFLEIAALTAVLEGKLHTSCPSCGCISTLQE